ncbi:MAG TPA: hypothetical protein VHI78_10255 [Bacteroidales bacterium]|jgi:hypothetical protein|nr:hypothetical protein [Bacteroidales bacterium]
MRKVIYLVVFIFFSFTALSQKGNQRANSVTFNPNSGYVNTTEIQPSLGISVNNVPYGKYFLGLTNISGYQISLKNSMVTKKIQGGIGTGVFFYNEGTLMPLFLDFRFIWSENTWTPFVFATGGGLIHFNDFNRESRLFINPGAGIRYSVSENVGLSMGAGLLIQSASYRRDSFVNLKIGLCFKP